MRNGTGPSLRVCRAGILAVNPAMVQRDGPAVNIAESFEQDSLSFHYGKGGVWADVTEAQNPGSVTDDGNGVPFAGQLVHLFGIFYDVSAWRGDAGAVPYVEITQVFHAAFG